MLVSVFAMPGHAGHARVAAQRTQHGGALALDRDRHQRADAMRRTSSGSGRAFRPND
jgi:hypothetical protein